MVVLTACAVATVLTGGTAAIVGAGAGGSLGGVGVAVTATAEAAATGSAIAGGASLGAIAGAGATGTAAGASVGAAAGGIAGSAVSTSAMGGGAIIAGTGGTGLLVLGASFNSNEDGATFDCWKPVIHDKSKEPSRGMLLKDIYSHPNVLKVTATEGYRPDLPKIVIENIWNEVFEIEYLLVHATGNIICHALHI